MRELCGPNSQTTLACTTAGRLVIIRPDLLVLDRRPFSLFAGALVH